MQQKNCDNCSYAHYLCKSSQISEFTYKVRSKKRQSPWSPHSSGTQCMRLKYQPGALKRTRMPLLQKLDLTFALNQVGFSLLAKNIINAGAVTFASLRYLFSFLFMPVWW